MGAEGNEFKDRRASGRHPKKCLSKSDFPPPPKKKSSTSEKVKDVKY